MGIEMQIESVEAKAKLSQNRSDADRRGVIAGLRQEQGLVSAPEVAKKMQQAFDR